MNTEKIFNPYQADYLIKNGCITTGAGLDKCKVYIKFLCDKFYDQYMESWKTRMH
jgi:hypothetical protein